MARILTEQEVASTGGVVGYTTNLCCTAGRAGALNCNVTSPSGAASNQLITGVSKKAAAVTVTGHRLWVYTDSLPHISGSGGTSNALTVTVRYYTTYSDGTESYSTVSSSATITYNTTSSDSAPSSWYSSSSYGRITVGQNPYTSARTVGYAWANATYNGYSATDRSTVIQDGYTPDGPTVVESFLVIAVSSSVPDISADGGYSEIPEIVGCLWVTRYSDGTTPNIDIPASQVTWSYGKVDKGSYTTSNPPSETVPQYYSGTIYGQFYANSTNSTSRTLLGWTFIKGVYNGSTDYARCEVYQSPRVSTPEVYKVHVTPLTYNGTTYPTPSLTFYNGSSTIAGQGHGRVNGTQTLNYYSWSQPKVTGIHIIENGAYEYVRYITVRAYNGSILLDKYYIGGSSSPRYVPLSTSFNTSDYSSGQTIHIYYYYS